MKERVLILVKYYLFWILFFAIQKPVFMIWQHRLMGDISAGDWFQVILHGLPLDLSVAAYISMAMGLILCISFWVHYRVTQLLSDILTGICLFVGLWTMLGDNGCFPAWGYHLDKSIFVYLSSPREALACAEWWAWALGFIAFVVLFILCWCIYRRWIVFSYQRSKVRGQWSVVLLLLITALLFLPARGSVTVSTMNTGRVYFSDNAMLNQAAINPLFNIIESLSEQTFDTHKYTYMSSAEAEAALKQLLPDTPSTLQPVTELTDVDQYSPIYSEVHSVTHVILVILESFSMNAWSAMPHVQEIASQGIFFSNAYASSYRTDRGVVAVLSGFPGQPTSSLMTAPSKSARLPNIGLSLGNAGYETRFFYGGDEDFTNMRSYLIAGGFHNRICDRDFPLSDRLSKWGVPDHILFPFAANEIEHSSLLAHHKSLDVILSLSSHEPFDVPYHHLAHPYLNSVAYTDSCLGAMVERLSHNPEWSKTLLVLVPDHGYPYPDGMANFRPERYRIPMVVGGGVVAQGHKVDRLCSQIDLVPTLLSLMGLEGSDYYFGKNILTKDSPEFAFFSFNDGFGLIRHSAMASDTLVIDSKSNRQLISPLHPSGSVLDTLSRAMMQSIMQYIDSL